LEELWRVIARTPEPVLEPEEPYEVEGDVPNVVFPRRRWLPAVSFGSSREGPTRSVALLTSGSGISSITCCNWKFRCLGSAGRGV